MKDIIIVCAGSTGVEVAGIIECINMDAEKEGREAPYRLLGFIDDTPGLTLPDYMTCPILGGIKDWHPIGDEVYALANTKPKAKEKLAELLKARGCRFETIIAPYARVKPHAEIGEGSIITAYNINNGAKIGKFVNIQGSMIGGTTEIGDYSTTLGFANIPGARIGKRVYVGSQAVVMAHKVGDDAVICVGSIVLANVRAGTKVFGNPAKRVDW